MSLPLRARPPGCITDLVFDRWFAGELDPDAEPAVLAHTQRCVRCSERHTTLALQRSTFLALRPSWSPSPASLVRRHWAWVVVVLLLAAAALAGLAAHA